MKLASALQRVLRPLRLIRRTAQRGMTLVEIMVVMAIIAIIGTAVAFGVLPALAGAQEDTARTAIRTISTALTAHYTRNFELPQSLDALVEGGMLKADQLQDPWKKPFQYNVVGTKNFKLCSGGEDGAIGGNDDICNDDDGKK
jgi:general secretion pathway protein G